MHRKPRSFRSSGPVHLKSNEERVASSKKKQKADDSSNESNDSNQSNESNESTEVTREQLIAALNEDLAREYQAIIAYVVYSQAIKGAQYMNIAKELEKHAAEELKHALIIAKQIDYLGGDPAATPKPVKTSDEAKEMLRFDLENERVTILEYRKRLLHCESL